MALFGGMVSAGYLWIDPAMPTQVDLAVGEIMTYDVYFHNDTPDELFIAGYELMFHYDASELEYVDPGVGPPPLYKPNPIPNYPTDVYGSDLKGFPDDDLAGNLRTYALMSPGEYFYSGTGDLQLFTLEFEVIAGPVGDMVSDCVLMEQLEGDPYGIAAFWYYDEVEEKIYDKTYKFNGAEGADVGIPEPTTTALLGIGLLGALLRKRS